MNVYKPDRSCFVVCAIVHILVRIQELLLLLLLLVNFNLTTLL